MKKKTGLILEGGGVRGAYTAGALSWLAEQGIHFDYNVGISSGAAYLALHLSGETELAHRMATEFAVDPKLVGVSAFLKCRHIVDIDRMFKGYLQDEAGYTIKNLRESDIQMETGVYDLEKGETVFYSNQDFDDELQLLQAGCSLPIASSLVDFEGRKLLDGGITKMIPIERALEQKCKKCLIITTKPADYVRKPASKFVCFLMAVAYRKYPSVLRDYRIRHKNYYKQMKIVQTMVEKGRALQIAPSETIKVNRFKGDPEKCEMLYKLGYRDMEARKEEIHEFFT